MSEPVGGTVGPGAIGVVGMAVGSTVVVAAAGAIIVGAAGIAVAGAAVRGAASACFGVARMTGDIVQGINDRADRLVSEEVARVKANMPKFLIQLNDPAAQASLSTEELANVLAGNEQAEFERSEKVVAAFAELMNQRAEYEKHRKLKPEISGKLKEQLAELESKKEVSARKLRDKEKETASFLAQEKTEQQDRYLATLARIQTILNICITPHFLKEAKQLQKELDAINHDDFNIVLLNNLIIRHRLEEISMHFADEFKREQFAQTLKWRLIYESDAFVQLLGSKEQNEFYAAIASANEAIKAGTFSGQQISAIDEIHQKHQSKGVVVDAEQRYLAVIEKSLQSLRDSGYGKVKSDDSDLTEYVLEAFTSDRKRARIFIRKPGAPEGPALRPVVDEEPYDNHKSHCKEVKRITDRLEELGIVTEWKETSTHFKNKLKEDGVEQLKKELEGQGVEVSMVDDSDNLLINGRQLQWRAGTSIKDLLNSVSCLLNSQASPEQQVRQSDRLKEVN